MEEVLTCSQSQVSGHSSRSSVASVTKKAELAGLKAELVAKRKTQEAELALAKFNQVLLVSQLLSIIMF